MRMSMEGGREGQRREGKKKIVEKEGNMGKRKEWKGTRKEKKAGKGIEKKDGKGKEKKREKGGGEILKEPREKPHHTIQGLEVNNDSIFVIKNHGS